MGKHLEVLFLGLSRARVIHHSFRSRIDLREIADSVILKGIYDSFGKLYEGTLFR